MITEDKNEFVRIKDFTDIKVRIPNPDDDYLRPITYICDEELALAMNGFTPCGLFSLFFKKQRLNLWRQKTNY